MKTLSLPIDKSIKINGLKLHYLDWGNESAFPMVLLHGLCSNAHYWDFFASSIKDDYRILAIDQRGHGDSDWPGRYGPKEYVSDLESFVASLGLGSFVLIGHSMGGINSVIYAARYPDQVSALVIVDIGPKIAAAGVERMERERAGEPEAFTSEQEAISYMQRIEPRQPDEFIRYQAKHALWRDDKGNFTFRYDKALRSTELRSPEWLWEYVGQVVCPCLLVHGAESDMLTAEAADTMAGAMEAGSVVDIERSGHSVAGDNPRAFEAAVRDFLRTIQLG